MRDASGKLKVLFIQLPVGGMTFLSGLQNVPLAAGYLKAMAFREGLLDRADIEILDVTLSTLSSDAVLIDHIVDRKPDVLCFSLYMWNSLRSLYLAEEVKKRLDRVFVVVGGIEVTRDSRHVLDHPAVDIGCIGEGEVTFTEILTALLDGRKDFGTIKGISFRQDGRLRINPPREPIADLDRIPSPFKLGFLNPREYGIAFCESTRGCMFKCAYCSETLRP
ncbi:MAG: B12-binding domain-containing radical SAM protein, partial [Endomicrobiales bacterium]